MDHQRGPEAGIERVDAGKRADPPGKQEDAAGEQHQPGSGQHPRQQATVHGRHGAERQQQAQQQLPCRIQGEIEGHHRLTLHQPDAEASERGDGEDGDDALAQAGAARCTITSRIGRPI